VKYVPLALAVVLCGCTPHKVTRNPAPPIDLPGAFAGASSDGGAAPDRWWKAFDDPQLD
jgi:outer membrane protein TolC